jgi:hypothetical protein
LPKVNIEATWSLRTGNFDKCKLKFDQIYYHFKMKGRDNKRSRSEIQSQMEDKSFDNDSDWSLKIDQALKKTRPKPPRA